VGFFLPRLRDKLCNMPSSRCLRHVVRLEWYNPSLRELGPDLALLGTGVGCLENAEFSGSVGSSMLSAFDDLGNFRVYGLLVQTEIMTGVDFMLKTPTRPTLISQQASVSPSMT